MRALFLLLVLANLVFYAYAHVARVDDRIENHIPRLQMNADQVRIVQRTAPPAGAAFAAPAVACLEWGQVAAPDVARAEALLARLGVPDEKLERSVTASAGYWVYMPPLGTKAEIARKIGELKALGITEFFVVQEANEWRNAISLGIFRTEDAAEEFHAGLRKRGVRSAVTGRRDNFFRQVAFYVREPDAAVVEGLAGIQREFAGTELRAVPCPERAGEGVRADAATK
jgi:hypothetical protein